MESIPKSTLTMMLHERLSNVPADVELAFINLALAAAINLQPQNDVFAFISKQFSIPHPLVALAFGLALVAAAFVSFLVGAKGEYHPAALAPLVSYIALTILIRLQIQSSAYTAMVILITLLYLLFKNIALQGRVAATEMALKQTLDEQAAKHDA